MSHHCHARGCAVRTQPRFLMCARHWRMVPSALQAQVWATYRPGQEVTKTPSRAWVEAADAAISAVAELEARRRASLEGPMALPIRTPQLERARGLISRVDRVVREQIGHLEKVVGEAQNRPPLGQSDGSIPPQVWELLRDAAAGLRQYITAVDQLRALRRDGALPASAQPAPPVDPESIEGLY